MEGLTDDHVESFLSQLEVCDLTTKMDDEINRIKKQISSQMKNTKIDENSIKSYAKFLYKFKQEVSTIKSRLNIPTNKVEKILDVQQKCKQKKSALENIQKLEQFLCAIEDICKFVRIGKEHLKEKQFDQVNECLSQAKSINNEMKQNENLFSSDELVDFNNDFQLVQTTLKTEICFFDEDFVYELLQTFKKSIHIDSEYFYCDFASRLKQNQFESLVHCILNKKEEFVSLLSSSLKPLVDSFVQPIFTANFKILLVENNDCQVDDFNLKCKIKLIPAEQCSDEERFNQLKSLLSFVLKYFTWNESIASRESLVLLIGQILCPKIYECLIKCYFNVRLPKTESEIDDYMNEIQNGRELESFMSSLGLLSNDRQYSTEFQNFVENIKNNFQKKVCSDSLFKMRAILNSATSAKQSISAAELSSRLQLRQQKTIQPYKVDSFMEQIQNLFEVKSFFSYNRITIFPNRKCLFNWKAVLETCKYC